MHASHALPEIVIARVLIAGGPYRAGDEISLALNVEGIGRLVAHDAAVRAACSPFGRAVVPEIISALVTHPALSYSVGDVLTLSFVDPQIARVAAGGDRSPTATPSVPSASVSLAAQTTPAAGAALTRTSRLATTERAVAPMPAVADTAIVARVVADEPAAAPFVAEGPAVAPFVADEPTVAPFVADEPTVAPFVARIEAGESDVAGAASRAKTRGEPVVRTPASSALTVATNVREAVRIAADDDRKAADPTRASDAGVSVRLDWSGERLRRFVAVVDKLFTIDRLGWYRHALAMRLLIPDAIGCGDVQADLAANRHLQALRGAALSAFGNPLLAACMPNFTVTSEWLQTIEGAGEARAIAGLRDALLPYVEDEGMAPAPEADTACTVGTIARHELLALGALSVDAFLPILIPAASHDAALTRCLLSYRQLLIELFGQTARCGELVRLNQMAQPNHSLDDRLWQLTGAAGEAFGGQALA